jgi:DNA processing protein
LGAGEFASNEFLAVVGSRNPTPQGAANARHFSKALALAGLTVVSGLALGVDGAAHEGALDSLEAGLKRMATAAVVGTGLDHVYPKDHRDLAHRIAQNRLLISEYPLGTPPLTANFPKRNRLIAGLAQGTLVIEAALQSGSLITARLAE